MTTLTPDPKKLSADERIFYRDLLRAARYAALADSEGFHEVCFALESLGLRLHGKKADLGTYQRRLKKLAEESVVLSEFTEIFPAIFTVFDALYDLIRNARNDAMHTGVYARHATAAAIELCIGLESAIMKDYELIRHQVKHCMVKSPISVEPWQPVAHARQLMLTHSFSFLPVKLGSWKLISENSLARYLHFGVKGGRKTSELLGTNIQNATEFGLVLIEAKLVELDDDIHTLFGLSSESYQYEPRLWLVKDQFENLCGVLSPFELM